jgi:hypothetical protein
VRDVNGGFPGRESDGGVQILGGDLEKTPVAGKTGSGALDT